MSLIRLSTVHQLKMIGTAALALIAAYVESFTPSFPSQTNMNLHHVICNNNNAGDSSSVHSTCQRPVSTALHVSTSTPFELKSTSIDFDKAERNQKHNLIDIHSTNNEDNSSTINKTRKLETITGVRALKTMNFIEPLASTTINSSSVTTKSNIEKSKERKIRKPILRRSKALNTKGKKRGSLPSTSSYTFPSISQTKTSFPPKNKPSDSTKNPRLTKEEEASLSHSIRSLKRAMHIHDTLIDKSTNRRPTEEEWAKECGVSVMQLRRIMVLGREARTKLVAANAGLVMQIAKRYSYELKRSTEFSGAGGVGTILTLQDMVQEGNLGLMEAAQRFESSRGFRFSTYAAYWVRQRILRCIADHSRVIRLPVHVHSTLRTIRKERIEMEKEIGRQPSLPELAHRLEMSIEKLRLYTDSSRTVLSLEVPVSRNGNAASMNKDDKRTLGDRIASDSPTPEEDAEFAALRQDIKAAIDGLGNDREREVVIARFGLEDGSPKTLEETARRLGISRDRVRMVEARALNKLRHPQRNYRLKEYVGEPIDEEENDDMVEMNAFGTGDTLSYHSPEEIWSV